MLQFRSGDSCFINKLFNAYQSFLSLEFQNGPILCYVQHFACDELVCLFIDILLYIIISTNFRFETYAALIYL